MRATIVACGIVLTALALASAPASADTDPTRATLVVKMPSESAELYVQGALTKTPGLVRTMTTPPLAVGSNYLCTFKAVWKEGGKELTREASVRVAAGKSFDIDLAKMDEAVKQATAVVPPKAKPAEPKKVETPTVKAEKIPAPKAVEPKKLALKEEPKVEVKKEEPKVEAKKEEPKTVVKKEEPKVEAKKEEPKVVEKKAEPKTVAKTEEPKVVPKTEEPKVAQKEEPKPEEKKEEAKAETKDPIEEAKEELAKIKMAAGDAQAKGDIAWMLVSSALVMLMVPGLALFYAGMVRRKNVLATIMQSSICLAIVGVYWVAIGYCLAFGESQGGLIGWSPDKLLFLQGVKPDETLANTNIPIYLHVLFQGMFAIITPALISGALAERIRFGPYCLFCLIWVTVVYCPLAHMVWAMNWWGPVEMLEEVNGVATKVMKDPGTMMVGLMGKNTLNGGLGALDFAGGTVVHIAAGLTALGSILVVRKRLGYPAHAFHPNSMILTVLGAGLLWFGWFGFNGGSAVASSSLAVSAFAATQAAAAAAAVTWMAAEWLHKGKPTALGWASGVVAGLVAVTPASGFVYMWGGLAIGAIAGVVCYAVVCLKGVFKYDDSLDVFGVHGVGGFLGAVLTGVFCYLSINSAGADGWISLAKLGKPDAAAQTIAQLKAAGLSALLAFVAGVVLTKVIDLIFGFITTPAAETEGLDRTEHGEVGFDYGPGMETSVVGEEPKSAVFPPGAAKRFTVVVQGPEHDALAKTWSDLCQPATAPPPKDFLLVYPHMTTVQGNRFRFNGGDPEVIRSSMERLLKGRLGGKPVNALVE